MLLCRVAEFSYIKLGHTDKPFQARLQHIRAGVPFAVDVLTTRPGTKDQEKELLAGAREWRHDFGGREWFVDCPELRRYCDTFFFASREVVYEPVALSESEAVQNERKFGD
jgi:hypothetical protein